MASLSNSSQVTMRCATRNVAGSVIFSIPTCYSHIRNDPFWKEFIPGVELSHTESLDKSTIEFKEGTFASFDSELKQVVLPFDPPHIKDLIVIVGYLLERERQKNRIYTMHGSAVSLCGKGVAFIGGVTGIGKTSTALACSYKANGLFISDEKFLIDSTGIRIVGGIKSAILKSSGDLNSAQKVEIEPKPVSLKKCVVPVLLPKGSGLRIAPIQYNYYQTHWLYYEEMTRDIRLVNGLVDQFSQALPSLDTQILAKNRVQSAAAMANSIPCYYVAGDEEALVAAIEELLK